MKHFLASLVFWHFGYHVSAQTFDKVRITGSRASFETNMKAAGYEIKKEKTPADQTVFNPKQYSPADRVVANYTPKTNLIYNLNVTMKAHIDEKDPELVKEYYHYLDVLTKQFGKADVSDSTLKSAENGIDSLILQWMRYKTTWKKVKVEVGILFSFVYVSYTNVENEKIFEKEKKELENSRDSALKNNGNEYRLYPTQNMWTFIKLNTRNGQMWQVQWSLEDNKRFVTNLSSVSLVDKDKEVNERFALYSTTNIFNFILLDQLDGRTWQVQWSQDPNSRSIIPIE